MYSQELTPWNDKDYQDKPYFGIADFYLQNKTFDHAQTFALEVLIELRFIIQEHHT